MKFPVFSPGSAETLQRGGVQELAKYILTKEETMALNARAEFKKVQPKAVVARPTKIVAFRGACEASSLAKKLDAGTTSSRDSAH